jgi:hypothetical protein
MKRWISAKVIRVPNSAPRGARCRLMALKRPAVAPAEDLLTEAVLKHARVVPTSSPAALASVSVCTDTERSRRISRTALSDKTSRLHPRRAAAEPGQTYEPEVPVEVREWIAPALASSALVLEPHPPAQPHSHVCVERAIRLAGGADAEVIGPPAERAVQLVYELCGLLPGTRADLPNGASGRLAARRWQDGSIGEVWMGRETDSATTP